MRTQPLIRIFACAALLAATPAMAQSQQEEPSNKQVREGLWVEIDLGYSTFGCDGCSRRNELATDATIGGAVGEQWLVGLMTTQSISSVGEFNERIIGVVGLGAHYYPTPAGGFHVRGSIGVAYASFGSRDADFGSLGGTLGVGYDTPRTGSFGFTPFAAVLLGRIEGDSFNAFQVGVGVSWH